QPVSAWPGWSPSPSRVRRLSSRVTAGQWLRRSQPWTSSRRSTGGPSTGQSVDRADLGQVLRRSGAGRAVHREAGRRGVAGGPGALEAERGVAARRDRAVITQAGDGHVLAALAGVPVPGVGDLLIAAE